MQKRTEEEMLKQSPIKLKFGEKEYAVKPLNSRKAAEWREQLSNMTGEMVGKVAAEPPAGGDISSWIKGEFMGSVTLMLTKSPEKLAGLICAYATEIKQDEILDNATDEQILVAFSSIMQVAFPFFSILGTLMEMQKLPNSSPASKYTN